MLRNNDRPIALVLSGGGVRAMAFHAGVLLNLAEKNELERVKYISTVSGGSLLIGIVFNLAGTRWPTASEYIEIIHPKIKKLMCSASFQGAALKQLIYPKNWKYILSRSNLLAIALHDSFGISEKLKDLPVVPEWSVNGTTAENGKRFRFKRDSIGDYQLGYAESNDFALAKAMAVSAAFPGGLGPLYLQTKSFSWTKPVEWNSQLSSVVKPIYKGIHLYDGGVYDNLGLEPFFDAGAGKLKIENCEIIVSDASAPLKRGFTYGELNPFRLTRILDIISDQSRALRVRTFINYIKGKPSLGRYFYIAQANLVDTKYGTLSYSFPTTLRKLKAYEFDALSSHGYNVSENPTY